jgi:hypothetical protein
MTNKEKNMPLVGENMNLREYLFIKRMTIQEFSEIVDYSRVHISGIINGKLKPSRKLAKRIEKETNGEVTAKELVQNISQKEDKPNPKISPKVYIMEKSLFETGE